MRVAIAEVFPNTKHRACQWHIMRKARDSLGVLYGKIKGFEEDLQSCINLTLTVEEFEKGWIELLKNHNLQDNNHLALMFITRERWVPAYFRDIFFADMSTSQRSESANAILKFGLTLIHQSTSLSHNLTRWLKAFLLKRMKKTLYLLQKSHSNDHMIR
jgi:hypothetical protein